MVTEITTTGWILAYLGAFLLGISKSGLKGIGIMIVTIMALVFGGKPSTGVLMPMLLVGDVFAVSYYRRYLEKKYLYKLLPWMLIGVLLGVYTGNSISEDLFKKGMAVIIAISVAIMLWWDRQKGMAIPSHPVFAGTMGLSAGFATMIGNLAGAFSNLYFLAMRLPKNNFIGTTAWLLFLTNLCKLPFHIWVWETVTKDTLTVNLYLLPALVIGLFTGVQLVSRIKEMNFRKIILILTALGALLIFLR